MTALAFVVAYAPVALMLGRPWLIALVLICVVLAGVFVSSSAELRELRDWASARPRARAVLASAVASLFPAALLAVATLAFFYAVLWLVRGIDSVFDAGWRAGTVAFVATLVAAFVPVFAIAGSDIEQSAEILYAPSSTSVTELSTGNPARHLSVSGLVCLVAVAVAEVVALLLLAAGKAASIAVTAGFLVALLLITAQLTRAGETDSLASDRPRPTRGHRQPTTIGGAGTQPRAGTAATSMEQRRRVRRRMRARGIGMMLVGICLLCAGLALHQLMQSQVGKSVSVPAIWLSGFSVLGAGVHSTIQSRGLSTLSAAELLLTTTRPPVLYMRSFADDVITSQRTTLGFRSEEQQMVSVLRRIGPVVALGAAGERVPPLGAARDYVPHERWRTWVREKLRLAALTVIRVGDGDSFWWEVAEAARHLRPQKVAFLLPREPEKYARFRARVAEYFPTASSLPEALPRFRRSSDDNCDLWGVLYFDDEGFPWLRSRLARPTTVPEALGLTLSLSKTQLCRSSFENMFRPLLRRTGARLFPTPQPLGVLATLAGLYVLLPMFVLGRVRRRGPDPHFARCPLDPTE